MQTVDRLHSLAFQNDLVPHGLHSQDSDSLLHKLGQNQLFKAAEMGIHHVERHLDRVEVESVISCNLQHVKVDVRILMAGKTDVADFARPFGFEHCFLRALLGEDAVRIFKTDNLMMLHKIDVVGL